jgi:hypothetical protein
MSSAALLYCNGGCPGIVSYFGVYGIIKKLLASAPKLEKVVYALKKIQAKEAKPILQATVQYLQKKKK